MNENKPSWWISLLGNIFFAIFAVGIIVLLLTGVAWLIQNFFTVVRGW